MAPFQLRDALLKQLRGFRERMMALQFLLAVQELPANERNRAAQLLSAVQLMILRLSEQQLDEIRDALVENEAHIDAAVADAEGALADVEQVKETIAVATNVLSLVARILP